MDINKILAHPRNKGYSERGADMGRPQQIVGWPERLHLQKVRLDSGGYDTGGAYWGMGAPLYCAFSPDNTENEFPIMVFVRAKNREEAKQEVLTILKGEWTFYR